MNLNVLPFEAYSTFIANNGNERALKAEMVHKFLLTLENLFTKMF